MPSIEGFENKDANMKKRIVTFGEIMMRLNPEGYLRFVQAEKFEASYGGGEANVAEVETFAAGNGTGRVQR